MKEQKAENFSGIATQGSNIANIFVPLLSLALAYYTYYRTNQVSINDLEVAIEM